MYTRYIPQPDGSFRRRSMPDSQPNRQPPQQQPRQQSQQEPRQQPQQPPPRQEPPACPPNRPSRPQIPERECSAGSFLKNLLPKNFCTEDLIVVLLLLLMAGDNPQHKSSALLTLALYLLM